MKSTLLIVTCCLTLIGCSEEAISPQTQPKIEVVRKTPLTSRFVREGEDDVILKVRGRSFHKVRGVAPYYISIDELHMIYLVTDGPNLQSICHFYDLRTGKDIEIKTHVSELGYEIGQQGERREVLESASGDIVRVARFHGDRKTVYTIDLAERRITDMKVPDK
jgi:hypothetical protein